MSYDSESEAQGRHDAALARAEAWQARYEIELLAERLVIVDLNEACPAGHVTIFHHPSALSVGDVVTAITDERDVEGSAVVVAVTPPLVTLALATNLQVECDCSFAAYAVKAERHELAAIRRARLYRFLGLTSSR